MTGNPTEETPKSSDELWAEVRQIDQEIAELTKEDSWQQLGQAVEHAAVIKASPIAITKSMLPARA